MRIPTIPTNPSARPEAAETPPPAPAPGRASAATPNIANLRGHPAPLDLPALRAVGYRQAWWHLEGKTGAKAFREEAIAATRQLAKRQLTWLRGGHDARWFDPASDWTEIDVAVALFLGR